MPIPPVIYTEAMYIAISQAIATGAQEVRYGDKTVRYFSITDMLRIQALMAAQLYPGGANGKAYQSFSKGTTPDCDRRHSPYFNRD